MCRRGLKLQPAVACLELTFLDIPRSTSLRKATMRRIRCFALGLLLALAGGALAVTSGGFPSRPVFSQTTVTCNGAAGCAPAAGTGTRQHICNTGATSGQRCYSLNV